MTVYEVAVLLGVDPDEIGLIVINGIQSELDDLVPHNCRLCFFPPMSGGYWCKPCSSDGIGNNNS
jgi:hypothetical protein